jgi:hypothetical protein
MKLTIIPNDGSVYKNNIIYTNLTWLETPSNIHALQWLDTEGSIEYNDGTPNESINVLPQWANNALNAWNVANTPITPTIESQKNACKTQAKFLLNTSDWSVLPDVTLINSVEFIAYRAILRELVINPVIEPSWPTEPTPIWN